MRSALQRGFSNGALFLREATLKGASREINQQFHISTPRLKPGAKKSLLKQAKNSIVEIGGYSFYRLISS